MPRDTKKRDGSRDRSQLTRSIDSEDLLFNFSEDDEMDRINRKALLGNIVLKLYLFVVRGISTKSSLKVVNLFNFDCAFYVGNNDKKLF